MVYLFRYGNVKLNQYISLPGKIIFEKDFSNHSLGTYTHANAENDWPDASPYFQDNAFSIVKNGSKKVLSLTMPGGKYGGVFKVTIPPPEEAYISYNLKFKDGFDCRRGGKLHGLSRYLNTL